MKSLDWEDTIQMASSNTKHMTFSKLMYFNIKWVTHEIPLILNFRVSVLFTFDSDFRNAFNGQDGKSASEHMDEIISLVKNAYKDITLRREIGTFVDIIAQKTNYTGGSL